MKIFERLNVVDDTGRVTKTIVREVNPKHYVIRNADPAVVESITRVRRVTVRESQEIAMHEHIV